MQDVSLRLFKGLAHSYDRAADYATLFQDRRWKRWVQERMPRQKPGLALDIGCGTLLMEERLRKSGWRFVGLDLSEQMLRGGQAKSVGCVELLARGDAEALPFLSGTFDLVISCYVAKYVELGRFVGEVARVTRPGGTVILYDFVRPRGAAAPFIQLYIKAGLRVAGILLSAYGSESAFTYSSLPEIVNGTTWDAKIGAEAEAMGLGRSAAERLTGGVVYACCLKKREAL